MESTISESSIKTRKRYYVILLLFITVAINYIDRTNISIAAPGIIEEFNLSNSTMGWLFSAWGWMYALFQIPGGWLADIFKPRKLMAFLLLTWSLATVSIAFATTFAALLVLRVLVGLLEAPSYSINNRIVTSWFPESERASAIGIYTSAQFVGLSFLTPVLAWIFSTYGWQHVFLVTGGVGILWAVIWYFFYRDPMDHKGVSPSEIALIETGGGLPRSTETIGKKKKSFSYKDLLTVLTKKKLWGIYIGQFGVGTTTIFFLTWFPTYLVEHRNMDFIEAGFAASVPYTFGFAGVLFSGFLSDYLVRRGFSLGLARKLPIITGMLLSTSIMLANYVDSSAAVIAIMALAFFATGLSSISWSIVSSVAPERLIGMTGGVFNFVGASSGIIIPIAIGYLTEGGSFSAALTFIATISLCGALSYIFLVGKLERLEG